MSRFVNIPPVEDLEELRRLVNDNFRRIGDSVGGGTGVVNQTTNVSSTVINYTGGGPWHTIAFSGSITVDKANGLNQRLTLTGNCTLNDPVGFADGDELTLRLIWNPAGGHTVTRATPAKWELPSGVTLYGLSNAVVVLVYVFDASGNGLLKSFIQL